MIFLLGSGEGLRGNGFTVKFVLMFYDRDKKKPCVIGSSMFL